MIRLPLHYLRCNILRVVCFFTFMPTFLLYFVCLLMNLLIMSYFLYKTDATIVVSLYCFHMWVVIFKITLCYYYINLLFIHGWWWSGTFICFFVNILSLDRIVGAIVIYRMTSVLNGIQSMRFMFCLKRLIVKNGVNSRKNK